MYRSFFNVLLIIFLSIISFLLTFIVVSYLKRMDPIMKEIKENSLLLEEEYVNAYVDDDIIIPGISGKKIDIENSYSIMRKYGSYKEDLLVYEEIFPLVSISNIYDKYVISGNKDKEEVSLIFKIEDTSFLEEIILILKRNDVIGTFFIDERLLMENKDIIDLLYLNNQNIEMLSNNYKIINIDRISSLLRSYISIDNNYCYLEEYNLDILNRCSFEKMHTIIPTINTSKYPYYDIKNNLSNGSIIKLNNDIRCLYELDFIIKFIKQKKYDIVSLKKMLNE